MNILVNGVPLDVVSVLDARAKRHYRSRTGEILAILTAACCGSDDAECGGDGAKQDPQEDGKVERRAEGTKR